MINLLTGLVGKVIQDLFSRFQGSQLQGDVQGAYALAENIGQYLGYQLNALISVLGAEKDGYDQAHDQVVEAAWALSDTAYNQRIMWQHAFRNVIPASLRWLDGHTHQWVDAKYDPIIRLFFQWFKDLFRRVKAIETWRRVFADPTLVNYRAWRRWFDTWPRSHLFTWHDWFAHPVHFAKWATPPLDGTLLQYWAAKAHKPSRDRLTGIIVGATPDMPKLCERSVVAILLSPGWQDAGG